METRYCVVCKNPIPKYYSTGEKISSGYYQKKKYCSNECFRSIHTHIEDTKTCKFCGKEFGRSRYNGALESNNLFQIRKFCSRECSAKAQSNQLKATNHYRDFLKDACEVCGSTDSLEGHHIDHDRENNTPDNIQTLCRHCHGFWHGTQVRLGLETIGRMPVLITL